LKNAAENIEASRRRATARARVVFDAFSKIDPSSSALILYQTEDGRKHLQVRLENQTIWPTQSQMAELFQTGIPNVNMHLRNIFQEGELQSDSVIKEFLITATDGKNYRTKFYNLEAIIAVGYRVKSHRGAQFRIWAAHGYKAADKNF
jgi:hypothetical protein